ncbi:MAG: amidophosphoribosyltransferase [Ignavibacteriae bacterium]|nr:MAG: amidophosphoribosyltransferase [Ignavibacteriota bacterium]
MSNNSKYIDKPKSNCAVFGIYNDQEAAVKTYFGLHALQHRGQEASGICTSEYLPEKNKYRFNIHKGHGLAHEVFSDQTLLTNVLKGNSAIGHNRYSTTGASDSRSNIQPFKVHFKEGYLALSHNGNFTNTKELRQKLQDEGTIFQTTSDSEILLHLIARSKKEELVDKILEAIRQVRGAYSIMLLSDDKLFAIRDPYAVRPLSMGKLGDSFVFASETCAFDIINAEYIREVKPGEVIMIDKEVIETGKEKSYIIENTGQTRHCIFEYVYFSRPDSTIFGNTVDKARRKLGKNLAIEKPAPKSPVEYKKVVVISVPDSSNTATLGFLTEGIKTNKYMKLELALIRSHYIGRTFIQPGQNNREIKVKTKFNTVKAAIKDRIVVIVDDSIVRGTTMKQLVKLVKEAKPKEIHLRITSPPIIAPCHYGMDFPSREELVANQCENDMEKIRQYLDVDSVEYLSLENLHASVPQGIDEYGYKIGYCDACFSGNYPIPIEHIDKFEFEDN